MTRSRPLISAIVPVNNGERFLAAALQSIFDQTYRPLEVLVIDDGSTDDSAAIAQSFPEVRYRYQAHEGVAAARNRGVAEATGSFISFLDQDDRWMPAKLERQLTVMQAYPELGYVLARQQLELEPGQAKPDWLKPTLLDGPQPGYLLGTLLARRACFDTVGAFDPAYRLGSDSDWFFRANDQGVPKKILRGVLLRRRVHSDNESRHLTQNNRELLHLIHRSLKRKHQ